MKTKEKKRAITLRSRGYAVGEIARLVGVSKGSVSSWVRDIPLSKKQQLSLQANSHSRVTVEKRRMARITNTNRRHTQIFEAALHEASVLSKDPEWCVGIALYWGEGGKTQNMVRIANSDAAVIQRMMHFFRTLVGVPEDKFRVHVHAFTHVDLEEVETYWSNVTKVPRTQFFKTYTKPSAASKKKRHALARGTAEIYVLDTTLFFRMMGWIAYLKKNEVC